MSTYLWMAAWFSIGLFVGVGLVASLEWSEWRHRRRGANDKRIRDLEDQLSEKEQEVERLRGIERQYTLLVTAPDTTERKLARLVEGLKSLPDLLVKSHDSDEWKIVLSAERVRALIDTATGEGK